MLQHQNGNGSAITFLANDRDG